MTLNGLEITKYIITILFCFVFCLHNFLICMFLNFISGQTCCGTTVIFWWAQALVESQIYVAKFVRPTFKSRPQKKFPTIPTNTIHTCYVGIYVDFSSNEDVMVLAQTRANLKWGLWTLSTNDK